MKITFEDRRILVSGAARGIGQAIVRGFLENGARVHAIDCLGDELEAFAQAIRVDSDEGDRLTHQTIDLADSSKVLSLIDHDGGDRFEILVHAAGGIRGRHPVPIESVSDDDWHAIIDANVTSSFNLARLVVPGMKAAGGGRIILISSPAGLGVSLTGIQAYGTAKAAEIGFTRQLAAELGRYDITVNSVAPGFMPTSPDYVRQWQSYSPDRQQSIIDGIALKRLGDPADIANAVMFLASDYAGYITGQVLLVKGGP
ncbi:MAG: SDR family NAD(P)-dependent oxidoreductase [Hyphomicrobiaceae bacterium]